MSFVRTLLGLTASLVILIATPVYRASAADSCSLKQVASLPASFQYGVVIDTKVNGTLARLYLDTYSDVSGLNEAFARRIGLPIEDNPTAVYGSGSRNLNLMTHVHQFELGNAKSQDEAFLLMPDEGDGTNDSPVGIFASDYLANYDLEIDPAGNKVVLRSQDHCRGQVVYWDKEYFATPILFRNNGARQHPELDVTVDGKTLHAVISTTAFTTVVRQLVAEERLGWAVGTEATPKNGTWTDDDGRKLDQYEHTIQSLTFGDVTLHNMKVEIQPINLAAHVKDVGSHFSTLNTQQPDIFIGMDLLKKFHIYLAYKEATLYYTIAAPPKSVAGQ